jgi:hypothetical protein
MVLGGFQGGGALDELFSGFFGRSVGFYWAEKAGPRDSPSPRSAARAMKACLPHP